MAALGLMATQGCTDDTPPSHHGDGGYGGAAGAGASSSGGGGTGVGASGGWVTGGSGGTTTTTTGSGGSGTGGTGTGPGPSCQALDACCEELGSAMYSACKSVVQMGYEATCDSTLQSYHDNGYCTGSTACADLAACCPELPPGPGWQETCNYYVEVNNAPQCEHLIGDYQLSGYCL
jgi:hypothetical protein